MKLYSLSTIRTKIKQYCKQIKAPSDLMTIRGVPSAYGEPHVEIDAKGYHYVVCERGKENERRITEDLHELLYWLMKGITFEMACDYELHQRIPNQDFRRLLFKTQLDLLKRISADFHTRKEEEIKEILLQNPYDDSESL
jgi:hypothetical protein